MKIHNVVNEASKIVLTASQFVWCPVLNETCDGHLLNCGPRYSLFKFNLTYLEACKCKLATVTSYKADVSDEELKLETSPL